MKLLSEFRFAWGYGGNLSPSPRNPSYVPFTTHFEPRPLGSPGLPLAFGPRVDCQRIGEAACKQGHWARTGGKGTM